MSNPVWARIKIFGDVKKSLLEELHDNIVSELGYELENNGKLNPNETYPQWFKRMMGKDKYIEFSSSDVNYGIFDDLEPFLSEHGIIYVRDSAGDGGDCVPEVVYFDGTNIIQLETNSDNNPILPVQTVKDLCVKANKLYEEFKKGNAPIYATEEHDTIDSLMAKYSLSCKQAPTSAELVLHCLEHEYPTVPNDNDLPPFKIVKG